MLPLQEASGCKYGGGGEGEWCLRVYIACSGLGVSTECYRALSKMLYDLMHSGFGRSILVAQVYQ